MRVLDEGLIAKILKHDISTSTALYFSRMGIGCIEYDGSVAENIILIDASHNFNIYSNNFSFEIIQDVFLS